MNHVIIYRKRLLAYSETFIKDQAEALTHWDYTFLTKERIAGLTLNSDKVLVMGAYTGRSLLRRLKDKISAILHDREKKIFREIQQRQPKLVHIHFGTDAVDVYPFVQHLNVPILVTLHGFDITTSKAHWQKGAKGKSKANYPDALIKMANQPNVHFVAVSEAIKTSAIAFGIPEQKVHVRYIGVDTNAFLPNADLLSKRKNKVLFIGRLVEKKGVEILINAYAKIDNQLPDSELIIVGDGHLRDKLEMQSKSLGVNVKFVGIKTRDEIKSLLRQVKLLCLPSITAPNGDAEGLGMVILEAQASGVPVISSARGGSTEALLHGKTGFAFKEGDESQLAIYLHQLMSDDDLLNQMSSQSVEFVRTKFALSACTQSLENLYEAII